MPVEASGNRPTRGERGVGMVELVVTVGLVALLLAAAVWSLDRPAFDLEGVSQELANDLREARLQATIRGAHFRVSAAGSSYAVERLQDDDDDGIWRLDTAYAARTVNLPAGIEVSADAADGTALAAEFDSRGVLVDPAGGEPAVVVYAVASSAGGSRKLSVWPSGQVRTERQTGGS